jgi:outer membrane murein-binding lipoprotein Lpp
VNTLTPECRTLRARVAALAKHAKYDPSPHCAAMREALWRKYCNQIDPKQLLDDQERHRRARAAMKADLARRALQAAKSRAASADNRLLDGLINGSVGG